MRRASLLLAAAVLTFAPAASASPTDVQRSEQLAEKAYEAYSKGDFTGAIQLYQSAYQASALPVILFNIANVYDKKLHEREAAIDHYNRYISSSNTEPELVKRAHDRIAALEAEATHERERKTEKPKPTPAEPPPPPSATGASEPARTLAFVALGVGGVGLITGAVSGLIASNRAGDADDSCPNKLCVAGSPGERDLDAAGTWATVSTVGFIVAGIGTAAGVVLYILSKPASVGPSTARTTSTTGLRPRLEGAGVGWSF